MPDRDRLHFLLLNVGHFLDHMFTLIFATVAALALIREWGMSYADLLKYATPGFFAFGVFAYPAGWIADKWSREGMMVAFFAGIGRRRSLTGFARTPLQIGAGLFVIGVFAAIYHPVGLAIVVAKWKNTGMRIAVNGVWGNLGVASAALLTGYLIDNGGWRDRLHRAGRVRDPGRARLRRAAAARDRGRPRQAETGDSGRRRDGVAPELRQRAVARVGDRVRDDGDFEHRLPIDDFRAAENFRRAAAGCRDRAWLGALGLPGRVDLATMIGSLAFVVFAVASMAQLVVGSLLDRSGRARCS